MIAASYAGSGTQQAPSHCRLVMNGDRFVVCDQQRGQVTSNIATWGLLAAPRQYYTQPTDLT